MHVLCNYFATVNFNGNKTIKLFGSYIFDGCASLTEITVPESVTALGTYTFRNSGLKSIDLSKTAITRLGTTSATGSVTVTTSSYVFYDSKDLKTVVLPEAVTLIGAYTFQGCSSLESINLEKVTLIGNLAFEGTALKSISLGAGFATLGDGALANTNLTAFEVDNANATYMADENGFLLKKDGTLVAY